MSSLETQQLTFFIIIVTSLLFTGLGYMYGVATDSNSTVDDKYCNKARTLDSNCQLTCFWHKIWWEVKGYDCYWINKG